MIPVEATVNKHLASYADTQDDAKYTFNGYMNNFLSLNRNLRTDANGVISLLDNVPSVFALPDAKDECFYSFTVNNDLNPRGTILIYFEASKPVLVYVSTLHKKPQPGACEDVLELRTEPHKFTPFKAN